MFLKTLVLRGFKSFPEKTTLEFEPGMTVIVGPNGSGKSNIVDAISWVLGEQGPRSLRGGKMEDVIFAGSKIRPALGMAEVSLTIDNSAGLLPIDFTEVMISRTLFRSGESEYRLNGAPCRLLDIQEVLSDSGIGREQHTIIGQGQLDEILQADPMQMRGFIEEAAGVTKHRRRKDRALRKIGGTEQNLARLSDLLSEIRRQLRPLREQAEVARKHSGIQEELGNIKMIRAARELGALGQRLGDGGAGDPDAPLRAKEDELAQLEESLRAAELRRGEAFSTMEARREEAWNLARLKDRFLGIARLAVERERSVGADLGSMSEGAARRRTKELEEELAGVVKAIEEAGQSHRSAAAECERLERELAAAGTSAREKEEHLAPRRAGHRESLAEAVRVRGEIGALERSLESAESEHSRLEVKESSLAEQILQLEGELRDARTAAESAEAQEAEAAIVVDNLQADATSLRNEREELEGKIRSAFREMASAEARAAGRGEETARRLRGRPGVVGVLADLVECPLQYRAALNAAAGRAESVLVVEAGADLVELFSSVGPNEGLAVLITRSGGAIPHVQRPSLADVVRPRDQLVASALRSVFVCEGIAEAAQLAADHPAGVFVTEDGAAAAGDRVLYDDKDSARWAEEAKETLTEFERQASDLDSRLGATNDQLGSALDELNEKGAQVSAAADRLSGLDREVHALRRELVAVKESGEQARAVTASISERLGALRRRLPEIEAGIDLEQLELERLQEEYAKAEASRSSAAEVLETSRLLLARTSERKGLLEERAGEIAAALEEARHTAAAMPEKKAELESALRRMQAIQRTAELLQQRAAVWAEEAELQYQSARDRMQDAESDVETLRLKRAGLVGALEDLRALARRENVERSEFLVRSRILEDKMRSEWQVDPRKMVERFGHIWEVEDESQITDPLGRLALQEDESLARRGARLDREVEAFGRVNPLAAQEFSTLSEREKFLGEQIADVRASRRNLMRLVSSIDEQIRDLFLGAFEDVAREYERLFTLLFPGGQGRLRLTDPGDFLATGIEVEARPGGKNLRRLSLLSGGERALSAVALLFSIFRARPSPFYVLDEVEAALDDVNLHRFLQLLSEFRKASQLLVVTHQKRTMEVGDVLYGVSIKPDGSTRVIAERMPLGEGAPPGISAENRVTTD